MIYLLSNRSTLQWMRQRTQWGNSFHSSLSSSFSSSTSWDNNKNLNSAVIARGVSCQHTFRISRNWRPISTSTTVRHSANNESTVKIVFYEAANDNRVEVDAPIGRTVLDVAIDYNIDIEGACGGELACSTCHVVLTKELFDKLPSTTEEENDMLDLAWGLTNTYAKSFIYFESLIVTDALMCYRSRLCCQLKVSEVMEYEEFKIPSETNNML